MALPGVRTTILDRFYGLTRTDLPGGPLIAVVGKRSNASSTDYPDFVPVLATSEQTVIAQFGEDSQLHRAYYELNTGGASRIALIPLPSNTTFNHTYATVASSSYPGVDPWSEAFGEVEAIRADIVIAWGRGGNSTDWDDYATPATPGNNATDFFYADNSSTASNSWVKRLADTCAEISYNSYPVLGVIGVKPIVGTENPTASQVATGILFADLPSKETIGDNGSYVSVVAAEVHPISAPASWGWSNGAALYAAMISRLPSYSATTAKPMYNIDRMRYNLSRTNLETLSGKGIVTGHVDMNTTPKWVDGTTFAEIGSDFVRLSTVRIVFDVVKLIKNVAQNYIGEGMSIQMQSAFHTQISSSLQSMTKLGAIQQSDFRVQYSPTENKAYVDLAIVPAFELREIVVQVSVNF